MNTRISSWTTARWATVLWNLATGVWLITGHAGVASTTGEGNIGAAIFIGVLWLMGNLAIGAVALLVRRRR